MTTSRLRFSRSARLRGLLSTVLCVVAASVGAGCWFPYATHVAEGELNVLLGAEPIEDVLAVGGLDERTEAKLEWVLDVRAYAIEELGLNGGESYSTFYNSDGSDVLYNISACPKDSLEPMTWSFPFLGAYEYIGVFDKETADLYADLLRLTGYDVFVYAPAGYSTVGWFADPLFSQALERDVIELTDLVIHEFTHNTVFKSSDSVFNESIATFVGHTGTLQYLTERYGADSELLEIAVKRWADADLFAAFWGELYDALDEVYSNPDLTRAEKIAQREEVFEDYKDKYEAEYLPRFNDTELYAALLNVEIDNAYVLIHRRYNLDLQLFQDVYQALGNDLAAAVLVFAEADDAPDPKQYLRDWLAAR